MQYEWLDNSKHTCEVLVSSPSSHNTKLCPLTSIERSAYILTTLLHKAPHRGVEVGRQDTEVNLLHLVFSLV